MRNPRNVSRSHCEARFVRRVPGSAAVCPRSLTIAQRLEGARDLLELDLGAALLLRWRVDEAIRVQLERELSIRVLDLFARGLMADAQHPVRVRHLE